MIFKYILKLISVSSLFLSNIGYCGWSSNGGLSSLDSDNIWFLGSDPIPYCIYNNNFNLSYQILDKIVQDSNTKWIQFLTKYKINTFITDKVKDGQLKSISLKFTPSLSCKTAIESCITNFSNDNDCESELQNKILFIFGKPNPVIKQYLNTIGKARGVALRTDYNHITNRSGGIIWINNFADSSWDKVSHMVLHEMGHVFGMKHDSTWVMATKIANILDSTLNSIGKLNEIESSNWPYSYKKGDKLLFTDYFLSEYAPSDYFPNKLFLPQEALGLLGFSKDGYFKIFGEVLDTLNIVKIKLSFKEFHSDKELSIIVNLNSVVGAENLLSPQLHTFYLDPTDKSSYSHTLNFDSGWISNSLSGIGDLNGSKIAVKLERKSGMILSLYFPQASKWVELSTVQFNSFIFGYK